MQEGDVELGTLGAQGEADPATGSLRDEVEGARAARGVAAHEAQPHRHTPRRHDGSGIEGDRRILERHLLVRPGLAGSELAVDGDFHPQRVALVRPLGAKGIEPRGPAPRDPRPAPVAVFLEQR